MKEFLLSNWYYLVIILITIVNMFILLLKNKVKLTDSVFEQLLVRLPVMIRNAEQSGKTGIEKKVAVMSFCFSWLCEMTGKSTEEVQAQYEKKIDSAIESILSTPQKKEVIIDE